MPGISLAMGKRLMLRYSRVSGSLPRMELAGLDVCHNRYSRLSSRGATQHQSGGGGGRINGRKMVEGRGVRKVRKVISDRRGSFLWSTSPMNKSEQEGMLAGHGALVAFRSS